MDKSARKLSFKPFDEKAELRIYYNGFLPHWRQNGCTYFVTFRTADSIPKPVVDQWREERRRWLAARGINDDVESWSCEVSKLSKADREIFNRHFARKLFLKLDECHGKCIFRDPKFAQIVAEAVRYFDRQRMNVGDFVIMPNHVHALLTPLAPDELEDILHSIKSFSANKINQEIGGSGTFWKNESHDHLVRDSEELLRIQKYIRANPAKANLHEGQFLLECRDYLTD